MIAPILMLNYAHLLKLTASSRGNMFLLILLTLRDAQNWPNKCNLYAKGFPIDDIAISDSSGLASIAYSSFLGISKNCLCYKGGPYLTQSVLVKWCMLVVMLGM